MFAENLKQAASFTLHRAFSSNGNHTGSPEPANDQAPPLLTIRQSWKHCIPHEMIFSDYNKSVKIGIKRGKETVRNESGVDNSQKAPHPGMIYTMVTPWEVILMMM